MKYPNKICEEMRKMDAEANEKAAGALKKEKPKKNKPVENK